MSMGKKINMKEDNVSPLCPECGSYTVKMDSNTGLCLGCCHTVYISPINPMCPVCFSATLPSTNHQQVFCSNPKCPGWKVDRRRWKRDSRLIITHPLLKRELSYSKIHNLHMIYIYCNTAIHYKSIEENFIRKTLYNVIRVRTRGIKLDEVYDIERKEHGICLGDF